MGPHFLDMSQYYKVLGTCRIPGIKRDKLRLPDNSNPAKHVVVMHNNTVCLITSFFIPITFESIFQFFKVNVYGNNGPLSRGQLLAQLKDCISNSKQVAPAVGILTSEHRDNWGKAHELLSQCKSEFIKFYF